ncbi:fibronectin type III domain-containing protein [Gorillibacterium timonense]|uniref:fibronectin type III domain-containing protein n=1 Tax=Gorillibacterium timonense TaxID=1689269 RepID=UPI00071E401F|nr:fibronectin type III domain-containing protein [Gorillibacterium timonense]
MNKRIQHVVIGILIICLAAAGIPFAGERAAAAGASSGVLEADTSYEWGTVPMGGGGYVTGMIAHPAEPGLYYIKTDVGGMYRWNAADSSWVPLLNHVTMAEKNLYGVDSIAIDPSDPDVVYASAGKYDYWTPSDILKSTDRGETWTRTELKNGTADVRMNSNGDNRDAGERIAVDPNNSAIVYFGSRFDGLWKSTTAASPGSWTKVTAFPSTGTSPTGITFVAFDRASGTSGTSSSILYAAAWDSGLYKSSDAGATWTLMNGSPVKPIRIAIAPDGSLYVTHTAGVAKYSASTSAWSNITPAASPNVRYTALALDPTNPSVLMTATNNGGHNNPIYRSTDGGATWAVVPYHKDQSVPWAPGWHWSSATSSIVINPFDSKQVWYTDWYNAWRTDDITASPSTWVSYPKGHEEIVTVSNLTSPPSGNVKLFSGVADVGGFEHTSLVAPPEKTYYTNSGLTYMLTTGVDFQESNPNFVVRVGTNGWQGSGDGGYSTDQGQTYTKFTGKPWSTVSGGRVAVSATSETIVWLPRGYDAKPQVSTDRGVTWTSSTGAPSGAVGGGSSIFKYNQPLASDRVDGAKFYLYNNGKFYLSDDSGLNWSQVNSSLPVNGENHNVYAAPGIAGEVWVSLDQQGLYRSSNAGTTFTKLSAVSRAFLFAFGKNAPGHSNPAVYVYGTVNGTEGIFRSDDMGTSWVKISSDDYIPGNDPNIMGADRQVFGRVYVGTNGSGILYGEPAGSSAGADREAPTPPSGLTAMAIDDKEIDLAWGASTDHVGIESYTVYKNNSEKLGTVSSGTFSFKVTGLTANTAYTFTVKAKDAEGHFSTSSNRLSVTTNTYPKELMKNPGFEADLTSWSFAADSGSVVASPVHGGAKALKVEAGKGGQQAVTGFQANKAYTLSAWGKAGAAGQSTSIQAWGSGVNSSLTFTSTEWEYKELKFLTPPDMSWLQIKIYNGAGVGSPYYIDDISLQLAATEFELPSVPANLQVTQLTDSGVRLAWDASTDNSGVEGYEIYQDNIRIGSSAEPSYAVSNLTANTPYTFTVRAKDTSWNLSDPSQPLETVTLPSGPNLLKNSGFESGASNWSLSNATVVAGVYHSGNASLRVNPSANGQQGISNLLPNTTYTLSAWGKATVGGSPNLYVQGLSVPSLTFTGAEFEFKSVTFTTSAAVSWIGIKFANGGSAEGYLDDVQLIVQDTTAPTAPGTPSASVLQAGSVQVVWSAASDANGVTRYVIYDNGLEIGTTKTTSFTVLGLSPGSHVFTVVAQDASGNASESSGTTAVELN